MAEFLVQYLSPAQRDSAGNVIPRQPLRRILLEARDSRHAGWLARTDPRKPEGVGCTIVRAARR